MTIKQPPTETTATFLVSAAARTPSLFVAFLAAICSGAVTPVRNALLARFVHAFDAFSLSHSDVQSDAVAAFKTKLYSLLVSAAFLAAAAWAVAAIQTTAARTAATAVSRLIRERYIAALLFSASQDVDIDTHLNEISADVAKIESFVADRAPYAIRCSAVFGIGTTLAVTASPRLALTVLAAFPVVAVVLGSMHRRCADNEARIAAATASAAAVARQAFSAAPTIAAFNRQSTESNRYATHLNTITTTRTDSAFFDGLGWGSYSLSMLTAFAISFYVGGRLVSNGTLSSADVLHAFSQIAVGITALGDIGQVSNDFRASYRALMHIMKNISQLENTTIYRLQIENKTYDSDPTDLSRSGIEFRNVSFRYPSRHDRVVLKNLNLLIRPGEHVAIVGESGCGKSTLVYLISRLFVPDVGSVHISGTDTRKYRLDALRECIGVAAQTPKLFDGSLQYNIALGAHRRPESINTDDIAAACDAANATAFIHDLDDGIDTCISGHRPSLSGGQIQRVALARAVLSARSGILILDEATSALDPRTEQQTLSSLLKARSGLTTIVISHRLSSLSSFDRIVLIKDGSVVEDGSFDDLVSRNTIFASLLEKSKHHDTIEQPQKPLDAHHESRQDEQHELNYAETDALLEPSSTPTSVSESKPNLMSSWSAVLSFFSRAIKTSVDDWSIIMTSIFGSFLLGFQFPLEGYMLGKVVSGYSLPTSDQISSSTTFWASMMMLLGFGVLFSTTLHTTVTTYACARCIERTRGQLFRHIMYQDMTFFTDPVNSVSGLSLAVTEDAEKIAHVSVTLFGDALCGVVNICVGFGIALSNSWHMVVGMMLPIPLIAIVRSVQARICHAGSADHERMRNQAAQLTTEIVTNIETIQLLCQQSHFMNRYHVVMDQFGSVSFWRHVVEAVGSGLVESIVIVVFAMGLWIGGTIMVWGWASTDQVIVALVTTTLTAIRIGELGGSVAYALGPAAQSLQRCFDIFDRVPDIRVADADGHRPTEKDSTNLQFVAELRRVSFAYPHASKNHRLENENKPHMTLMDVSLQIPADSRIALVGATGSGKSSIASLLHRHYDPQNGYVLFDDIDLRLWNLPALRSLVAVVSQSPDIFDTTIRENISYGNSSASRQDIIEAARMAHAHEFISKFPDGYETRVGENGCKLSGGQRQRIALSRIYLIHPRPRLIVLDESTSALDADTESIVLWNLDTFAKGIGASVVFITHRLETVQRADTIYVLADGRVVEHGSHTDLVCRGGAYSRLQDRKQNIPL